jgi:hypothetical protein
MVVTEISFFGGKLLFLYQTDIPKSDYYVYNPKYLSEKQGGYGWRSSIAGRVKVCSNGHKGWFPQFWGSVFWGNP